MTDSNLQKKQLSKRHYGFVVAFAVMLLFSVVYVLPYGITQMTKSQNDTAVNQKAPDSLFARQQPVRLEIPAINLDTTFVPPLGLNSDRTITVPESYSEVGWYKNGATPGEIGPAVILGHVDSKEGPAVFYSLGQLKAGDSISVTREDGSIATFAVTKLARHPQDNFPTLDVYGPTDDAVLRLVTCTGTYDRGEARYSHNLVVYAELIRE